MRLIQAAQFDTTASGTQNCHNETHLFKSHSTSAASPNTARPVIFETTLVAPASVPDQMLPMNQRLERKLTNRQASTQPNDSAKNLLPFSLAIAALLIACSLRTAPAAASATRVTPAADLAVLPG